MLAALLLVATKDHLRLRGAGFLDTEISAVAEVPDFRMEHSRGFSVSNCL